MFGGNKYKNGDPKKTSCLTPECYKYITIATLCVVGMALGAVFTVFFPDMFTAVLKQVNSEVLNSRSESQCKSWGHMNFFVLSVRGNQGE